MILTIDLGSTNLKTAIISKTGKIEKFNRRPYILDLTFLKEFCLGFDLLGLAISTQGPTFVALDKELKLIDTFHYYQSNTEVQSFTKSDYPSVFLPAIAYFMQSHSRAKGVTTILNLGDYIAYLLSGVLQTSRPNNDEANLAYLWNTEKIEAYGLDVKLFAPVIKEPIYSDVAILGTSIPILNITFDFFTMPFGLPYPSPSFAFNRTGTSEGINFIYNTGEEYSIAKDRGARITKYPIGNYFTVGYVQNDVLKSTFEKLRAMLGFKTIDELLHQDENFLNHLAHVNNKVWPLLQQYIVKYQIEIDEHKKIGFEKIYSVGGLSTSPWLNQYKANTWRKPIITLANHETELVGLAVQGYLQLGYFKDAQEALAIFIKEDKIYYPKA